MPKHSSVKCRLWTAIRRCQMWAFLRTIFEEWKQDLSSPNPLVVAWKLDVKRMSKGLYSATLIMPRESINTRLPVFDGIWQDASCLQCIFPSWREPDPDYGKRLKTLSDSRAEKAAENEEMQEGRLWRPCSSFQAAFNDLASTSFASTRDFFF